MRPTMKFLLICAMLAGAADAFWMAARCPLYWSGYGKMCYRVFPFGERWNNAKLKCESFGGTLATVTDAHHEYWLNQLTGSRPAWIGATDTNWEGHWETMDRMPLKYRNWCPGEPSNKWEENCALMNYDGKKCWDDQPCSFNYHAYICALPSF